MIRRWWRRSCYGAGVAWRAVTSVIAREELLVLAGLILLTHGLWPLLGQQALVAPGLVLLWIGVPQRVTFIARPPERRSVSKDGD